MKEKIAEWLLVIQGFRKFIVCLLVIIVGIVFRCKTLISGAEFVDLAKAVALGFMGTNSMEGLISVVKDAIAVRKDAGSLLQPPKDKSEEDEVTIVSGETK